MALISSRTTDPPDILLPCSLLKASNAFDGYATVVAAYVLSSSPQYESASAIDNFWSSDYGLNLVKYRQVRPGAPQADSLDAKSA